MHQMMKMAAIFAPQGEAQQHKHKQKNQQNRPVEKSQQQQIAEFRDELRTGDTIDLTTQQLNSGYRAVLTLETQYLNDPSMADVVDGTFTVLGKVTRVLGNGDESIGLIRKTALARLPPTILQTLFENFNALADVQGFAFPKVQWEIPGPVMQILPIAIFA